MVRTKAGDGSGTPPLYLPYRHDLSLMEKVVGVLRKGRRVAKPELALEPASENDLSVRGAARSMAE